MKASILVVAITALAITLMGCTKEEATEAHPILSSTIEGTAEYVAVEHVKTMFSGNAEQYIKDMDLKNQLTDEQFENINFTALTNSCTPYLEALKNKAESAGGIRRIICERTLFNTDKTSAKVSIVIKFKDPTKKDHEEVINVSKFNGRWLPALSQ